MPILVAGVVVAVAAFLAAGAQPQGKSEGPASARARAQVWRPTDIPAMDIMRGPARDDGFAFLEVVACSYEDEEMDGASPKFSCERNEDDELKVKYGGSNGEVYGEVLASRLLWALGFGADAMYPVRIVCRDCPPLAGSILRQDGSRIFDPATVERKMRGAELSDEWHWSELDEIDEEQGGAPRAHRDALKLLAVFLQHGDNKEGQQRLICLGDSSSSEEKLDAAACERPFMLIQDVGLTFGKATVFSDNDTTGVNLAEWSKIPVWKEGDGCVGNLPESVRGTLADPIISEEGRAFLAELLTQLTDQQLHDLFTVGRVTLRVRDPRDANSGFPTVQEWVDAFKHRREQIVSRRCA